jgi:Spy/CpxP family protein refolding chaperone
MRNRIFGFAGIAVLVVSLAILALGHGFQGPGGHGKGGHAEMLEHISRALSLTDAQKQQVKGIMDSVEVTASGIHAKLEEVHKQLGAATANGQFDENQVRTLANQEAQLEADMKVEHFRAMSKVFAILTPEQRAKAEEMHKQMGEHERHPGPPLRHPGF